MLAGGHDRGQFEDIALLSLLFVVVDVTTAGLVAVTAKKTRLTLLFQCKR